MTARRLALTAILLTGTAGVALHSQTDCARWLAAYKQQLLHSRAAHRLRAAKHRLLHHHTRPVHHLHHRMSPAESLRRFQVACGPDLDTTTPELAAILPPAETVQLPIAAEWPDAVPPTFDFAPPTEIAEAFPPDDTAPGFGPVGGVGPYAPGAGPIAGGPGVPVAATPEPSSWLLLASGMGLVVVWRTSQKEAR